MADRDYTTLFADTTGAAATAKDYTKGVKIKPAPPGAEISRMPEPPPQVQKLYMDMQQHLLERGHDQATIDQLMTPKGVLTNEAFDGLFQELRPVLERNMDAVAEAAKFSADMEKMGLRLQPDEQTALTGILKSYDSTVSGLSDIHRWWMKAKRSAGDKGTEFVRGTALNLTLGMSLLDGIDQFDKDGLRINGLQVIPGKMQALTAPIPFLRKVPDATIEDIENRTMPKITLHGLRGEEKEFSTGTSAAAWIIAQKVWGFGERTVADRPARALGQLTKFFGNEPMAEMLTQFANEVEAKGEERGQLAHGQIPPLVSALGEPSTQFGSGLSWIDIAEKRLGLEQLLDKTYKWMDDKGAVGGVMMAGVATTVGAYDTVVVPSFVVGGLVGKIPQAGVKVLSGVARLEAKVADIATEVARKSNKVEDAVDAVTASQRHFDSVDARYNDAIASHIRATGEPKAPAPLWRQWMAARRQLNNNKQWLETFKDPNADEVLMRAPRRNPKLLQAPPDDASSIAKEMHTDRVEALTAGPGTNVDWSKADLPRFQQRKVIGPDDAEQAGDALDLMIKTGGLAIDDVTLTPVAPEYHITPAAGPIGFIDWRNYPAVKRLAEIEKRFIKSISGGALPEKAGQEKFNATASSLRMLLVQEDVIRRNLGTARQIKDKTRIKIHTDNLERIRKVIDNIGRKGLPDEALKYDDVWLPPEGDTITGSPERFNRWLNLAGDRVVRGLYPGAIRTGYWNSMMGQLHSLAREPQRFFEVADPVTWERVRSAWLRNQQSTDAWDSMVSDLMLDAGIFKMRGKFNPKKHFHPWDYNPKDGERVVDLLNTKASDPEFAKMRAKLPAKEAKLHDEVRKRFDTFADLMGLSDSERYLEGYFHHMMDRNMSAGGTRSMDLPGLSPKAEIMVSHLMNRRGNAGWSKDLAAVLEVYGRAAHRKMILEPMFEDVLQAGERLAQKHNNSAFKTYVNNFVRQMQGKPGFLGEMIDQHIGATVNASGGAKNPLTGRKAMWRPSEIDRQLMGFTSALHSSFLGGSPRYPFMQIMTAIPTTAGRFGIFRTLGGVFKMATREGQALSKATGVYRPFIDMLESSAWRNLSKFILEKVPTISPFGVMSVGKAEFAIRSMTLHAALDMHMTKMGFASWPEAVEAGFGRRLLYEGLRSSEEVNHLFGGIGRQPGVSRAFGQGISATATQFLSFIWKQTDELISQASRHPSHLMEYLMMSGWASKVAAEQFGIDATNYVGLGYLPEDKSDVVAPGIDFMMAFVDVASAHNEHDPDAIARAHSNLMETMTNVIPGKVMLKSAAKAAERLTTGEQRNQRGELIRNLDFKDQTGLQIVEPPTGPPGLGGEAIPTIFMQQNIREELNRRGQRALLQEKDRLYFNMQTALKRYAEAVREEDVQAQDKWLAELENEHRIRLTGTSAIERAEQAQAIEWKIRFLHPKFGGDRSKMDLYMQTLERFGMGFDE